MGVMAHRLLLNDAQQACCQTRCHHEPRPQCVDPLNYDSLATDFCLWSRALSRCSFTGRLVLYTYQVPAGRAPDGAHSHVVVNRTLHIAPFVIGLQVVRPLTGSVALL